MGIPGVLVSPPVCSTFRQSFSVHSITFSRSSSPCPSCTGILGGNGISDRRILSLSSSSSSATASSTSFGGGCGQNFRDGRNQDCSTGGASLRMLSRFDESSESRLVVRAAARESSTLSKEQKAADVQEQEEEEDSAIRSQAAATFVGDDSILEERKVMSEEEDTRVADEPIEEKTGVASTSSTEPRPKRINFDYGFQAKFLRSGPQVPNNVFRLAVENFGREWKELRRTYSFVELEDIDPSMTEGGIFGLIAAYTGRGFVLFLRGIDKFFTKSLRVQESVQPAELQVNNEQDELRQQLKKLVLSNQKVWDRERSRPAVQSPWWILGPYYFLCLMLDVIFDKRPIQRFWFLETVARMPYFSYISMLHLYETLGWWRTGAEVRKVHFAEEWNEMHHLKIMESLGGDLEWGDRFIGQHAAFFYYWILNFMFLVSPSVAYNFSQLIEAHAVDTYTEFAEANEELLKKLPPPPVAIAYYESEDLYMYDEFQTSNLPESRRPKMNNLFDVFMAVAGDENEHVKTMIACQDIDKTILSPHRVAKMRK